MIKQNFSNVSIIGKLMILIGIFVIAPILILPWYPEDTVYAFDFLIPGGFSALLGILICVAGMCRKARVQKQNRKTSIGYSSLTVLFAWSWGVLIGALPFYISKQLTFIQSLFEAVSGWTTTGLSVIDVRLTPAIYLFHRSFMQYCGGLGFIMVTFSFPASSP